MKVRVGVRVLALVRGFLDACAHSGGKTVCSGGCRGERELVQMGCKGEALLVREE